MIHSSICLHNLPILERPKCLTQESINHMPPPSGQEKATFLSFLIFHCRKSYGCLMCCAGCPRSHRILVGALWPQWVHCCSSLNGRPGHSWVHLRLWLTAHGGHSSNSSPVTISSAWEGLPSWNDVMFLDAWQLGHMKSDIIRRWELLGNLPLATLLCRLGHSSFRRQKSKQSREKCKVGASFKNWVVKSQGKRKGAESSLQRL